MRMLSFKSKDRPTWLDICQELQGSCWMSHDLIDKIIEYLKAYLQEKRIFNLFNQFFMVI